MKYLILLALSLSFLFSPEVFPMDAHKETSITQPLWPKDFANNLSGTLRPDRGDNVIRITDITAPSLTVFPADKKGAPTPAVVIFPGGAYKYVVYNKEGTEIADWLNSIGITAIVVKYSVPDKREDAHRDGQRAMRLVRHNAKAWNINPNNVGTLGISAGGHLSARLSTDFARDSYESLDEVDAQSSRPDFNILIYPGSLGKNNDQEVADEVKVSAQTPPTFIVQTQDDTKLIAGTKIYDQALKKAGIPSAFHFFATGGHGYGLRPSKHAVSNWPMLCEAWLKAYGILENK